ncbi:hypothetical protein AVEN_57438-1 [Araneus ventricosus]|uniref:Uncharacterized protein n=1 Tax=Araneus ventricosus TaxID=182803 RepID=A0A4Y2CWR8_ARAVE|nr:hypothetical protein AVEN_57438-1 [Araneus ventricosus]
MDTEKKFGMKTDISVKVLITEDPWSLSKIQKAKLAYPAFRPILEMKLNSENRSFWQEIAPESPAAKRYRTLWDCLLIKDNVLYRKWRVMMEALVDGN